MLTTNVMYKYLLSSLGLFVDKLNELFFYFFYLQVYNLNKDNQAEGSK